MQCYNVTETALVPLATERSRRIQSTNAEYSPGIARLGGGTGAVTGGLAAAGLNKVGRMKGKERMFFVTLWENGQVVHEFEKLTIAKRYARGMGHTGEDHPGLTGYPPIAFVANEDGECVYNPRFSKRINSALSGLINAQPPDHF